MSLPRGRARQLPAFVAGILLMVLVVAGCDWAQVGYGPQHTGWNPSEPALTDTSLAHLTTAWSRPCFGATCKSALVAGGVMYVMEGNFLRALDPATGKERWEANVGPDHRLRAVANGLVYLLHQPATGSDQLVARDATNGALRFSRTPAVVG